MNVFLQEIGNFPISRTFLKIQLRVWQKSDKQTLLQAFGGLKPTGQLDSETVALMKKPRFDNWLKCKYKRCQMIRPVKYNPGVA